MTRFDNNRRRPGRCIYCRTVLTAGEMTRDHLLPRALGGKTVKRNLAIACRECNVMRDVESPEAVRRLLTLLARGRALPLDLDLLRQRVKARGHMLYLNRAVARRCQNHARVELPLEARAL